MTVAGDLTASVDRFSAVRLTFDGLSINRAYGTSCGLGAWADLCELKERIKDYRK